MVLMRHDSTQLPDNERVFPRIQCSGKLSRNKTIQKKKIINIVRLYVVRPLSCYIFYRNIEFYN